MFYCSTVFILYCTLRNFFKKNAPHVRICESCNFFAFVLLSNYLHLEFQFFLGSDPLVVSVLLLPLQFLLQLQDPVGPKDDRVTWVRGNLEKCPAIRLTYRVPSQKHVPRCHVHTSPGTGTPPLPWEAHSNA